MILFLDLVWFYDRKRRREREIDFPFPRFILSPCVMIVVSVPAGNCSMNNERRSSLVGQAHNRTSLFWGIETSFTIDNHGPVHALSPLSFHQTNRFIFDN